MPCFCRVFSTPPKPLNSQDPGELPPRLGYVSLWLVGASPRLQGLVTLSPCAGVLATTGHLRGGCPLSGDDCWRCRRLQLRLVTCRRVVPREPRPSLTVNLTSLQTSFWVGAWGQNRGPGHGKGALGTGDHLLQPPALTEEETWALKGGVHGHSEELMSVGASVEQTFVLCSYVCRGAQGCGDLEWSRAGAGEVLHYAG